MALAPLQLDDLTWEGLLEKIRRRIPARSDGRWTLHAPVDPGITLLELYAWLLEQRVYMLDQTPDPLLLAELALLGESPKPTAVAATVLAFDSAVTRVIPSGTEMQLERRTPRLVFSTERATTLLPTATPARAVGLRVGGADRTADLQSGRLLRLFPADGSAAEATLLIRTTARIPQVTAPAPLGLLVMLDPSVKLPPTWAERRGPVPPPAELSWWYPTGAGNLKRFPPHGFEDGTAGLRRSGVVRLPVPGDWEPESSVPISGSYTYPIVVRVARATWTAPPRVAAVVVNALVASHRRKTHPHMRGAVSVMMGKLQTGGATLAGATTMTLTATAVTGTIKKGDTFRVEGSSQRFEAALDAAFAGNSATVTLSDPVSSPIAASSEVKLRQLTLRWLPLPDRSLALGDLPPTTPPDRDVPPIERSVRLALRERDGRWHSWKPTLDLTPHGPGDRVFVIDRGAGLIRFGDGYAGRQPVLAQDGLPNARVRYWVGGGSEGNIGAGATWVSPPLSLKAKNVVDAEGGAELETPEDARAGASRFMTEVTRAVTESDYVTLATTVPGVAIRRAHAVLGAHPCYPCRRVPGAVTVFIVPDAPRDDPSQTLGDGAFVGAPVADRGALTAVRARLEATRLIGTEVFVAPAPYRPVRVLVQVRGNVSDAEELQPRLLDALRTFLDPLLGGTGDGWPFGESVRPSALLRRAQDVIGESGEVTSLAIGLDGAVPSEACADVPIRAHELVFLDGLELRLQGAVAARAGLR